MTVLTDLVKRELIWTAIKELNLTSIQVEFSGSGDSGQIDGVFPNYNRAGKTREETSKETEAVHVRFNAYEVTLEDDKPPVKLADMIQEMTDALLGNDEIPNWWDNEGGNGTVEWILDGEGDDGETYHKQAVVRVNVAVVTYETSYHAY